MPRPPRLVVPGLPHHVTQRGNYHHAVFDRDGDRRRYMTLLRRACDRYGCRIWAWCLMDNHVHLVLVPERDQSLAHTLNQAHANYARWLHLARGAVGHLWQERFYSCVLDESHLETAVRYVENNPVRAGMVPSAERYDWSSAQAHVHRKDSPWLDPGCPLEAYVPDWRTYLAGNGDQARVENLRRQTREGRPAGGEAFVRSLEERFGRSLTPRRPGRPPRPA